MPFRPTRLHGLSRALLLCVLAACLPVQAEWRWQDVGEVVALSDVHGADAAFERALVASGVIDEAGQWTGGARHLVITGDLLDRGAGSRAVMDLLMRLEGEAPAAGGRVTLLLGNHEVMNLVGDLRYVAPGEYAAFAAEETAEERARWRQLFLRRAAGSATPEELAAKFEQAHPPGFFAHRRAFRPDGRYGAWLLGKPFAVVVNDTAFVHGGLSPDFAALGLDALNATLMQELDSYARALAALTDAGLLLPGDGVYNHARILGSLPAERDIPDALRAAIDTVTATRERSVHDGESPTWYRGHVGCPAIVARDRLDRALEPLSARRVVIGHTPTANREVVSRLDERIVEIDTGMLTDYYRGSAHALVLPGEGAAAVIGEQGDSAAIGPDPRQQGQGSLTAADVEALLLRGEVALGAERDDGARELVVSDGTHALNAVFFRDRSRRSSPEVAAYRLDRLLGIGLVPVTVRRAVDGEIGAVQAVPERALAEDERAAAGAGAGAWCPLAEQWQAMYVFDALVAKPGRAPSHMLYDREMFRLHLSGHEDAFSRRSSRPRYLRDVELDVHAAWRSALSGMTESVVELEFGDVLDKRQRSALSSRRDQLLEGS